MMVIGIKRTFSLVIVIPCYNEANRLQSATILSFLRANKDIALLFSNDGSTDKTLSIINKIKKNAGDQVYVTSSTINLGKASAVRSGFLYATKLLQYEKIAYLDADLSTSLNECLRLSSFINSKVSFVFGSRISKIDNTIQRRFLRFLTGRILATLISMQLRLTVYDTQCGCKVFRADLAEVLFKEQFYSKWLFDVEIFHRFIQLVGKNSIRYLVKEIPLESWIDTQDSKVKLSYFFRLWLDLYMISKKYKKKEKMLWKPLPQNTY